jgi:phosphoribosylanthranilate isomerase
MALECLVKISSVNNLSDARYAAGMGVGLMGFDLNPGSENFVDPIKFNAITSWISGVKIVGELGVIKAEVAEQVAQQYQLDYLQVDPEVIPEVLKRLSLPVIIKLSQPGKVQLSRAFEKFGSLPSWYLLEPDFSIPDETLQWCARKASRFPMILGSNLTAGNVHEILEWGFKGIALRGGQEIRPGYKNFDELADILETLEID